MNSFEVDSAARLAARRAAIAARPTTAAELSIAHDWNAGRRAVISPRISELVAPARERFMAARIVGAVVVAFGFGLCLATVQPYLSAPACQIEVIDAQGDSWIVGSGDTLADAMQNRAAPPADWREYRVHGCK